MEEDFAIFFPNLFIEGFRESVFSIQAFESTASPPMDMPCILAAESIELSTKVFFCVFEHSHPVVTIFVLAFFVCGENFFFGLLFASAGEA